MAHPYRYLIERYFPASVWDDAECISTHECSPDRAGYPQSCVGDEGLISCGHGPQQARSWGPMQILDACWSPYMNPNSPFTPAQWGMVLDPNVNFWMASVIYSRSGLGAWTTCGVCNACDVTGGPIPHPDGPVEPPIPPPPPLPPGEGAGVGVVIGGLMALAGIGLFVSQRSRP